jgi:hypothetical protein
MNPDLIQLVYDGLKDVHFECPDRFKLLSLLDYFFYSCCSDIKLEKSQCSCNYRSSNNVSDKYKKLYTVKP